MKADVLVVTKEMAHEQWLAARKAGIGGSDASAIAGLNKWKSPISVYMDKIGESPEEDIQSEAAHFGNVLEEVVAQEFSTRTGLKVRKRNAILQHPKYPWMLANVDRLIIGEKVGLECKTASEYLKKEWEGEEVPTSYLIQCQHYMAVTGYEAWWIAVLIGGNKFIYKKIERDEEVIQYLIDIEKDFWQNHVEKLEPPMFDGSDASTNLLNQMYPKGFEDNVLSLSNEAEILIEARNQIEAELKVLDIQKKEYENKLKAMLGEKAKGATENYTVLWKSYSTNRFDSKRFKEEHPDLHKQYTKESNTRRFSIK
ncbi:YqaJ viral recombinase family protein [Bacillus mycoides]|uniref:YqaJ viral recombinase family nuclease n=1 Tax=Bacillus mycoides TaxID=1405 RepID=UPI0018799245|nr:YqaJ viral recombinase family protein [Bacillus mycoides]MBE7128126.1 hypothetical protein [Bacillus mycoides]